MFLANFCLNAKCEIAPFLLWMGVVNPAVKVKRIAISIHLILNDINLFIITNLIKVRTATSSIAVSIKATGKDFLVAAFIG